MANKKMKKNQNSRIRKKSQNQKSVKIREREREKHSFFSGHFWQLFFRICVCVFVTCMMCEIFTATTTTTKIWAFRHWKNERKKSFVSICPMQLKKKFIFKTINDSYIPIYRYKQMKKHSLWSVKRKNENIKKR